MNTQRLAAVLTLINLLLLAFVLAGVRPAIPEGIAPVLSGRALEIVDDQGKVRAQLIVVPTTVMPDGQRYPETTLFRLIDTNGRPNVKIGASEDGAGMSLSGNAADQSEWSGVQILAQGMNNSLKLRNRDGSEKLIAR